MTKQEALKSLKFEVYEEGHCSYIEEELDIAIDALEKQIAKKPTVLINDKDVRIGNILFKKGVKTYKCVCGYWITLTQEYCNHCGQKIDWSEVE